MSLALRPDSSSPVLALRLSSPNFHKSPGQLLFAGLCFHFAPLTESSDLCCSVLGNLRSLRTSHFVNLGCIYYWLGFHRYLLASWSSCCGSLSFLPSNSFAWSLQKFSGSSLGGTWRFCALDPCTLRKIELHSSNLYHRGRSRRIQTHRWCRLSTLLHFSRCSLPMTSSMNGGLLPALGLFPMMMGSAYGDLLVVLSFILQSSPAFLTCWCFGSHFSTLSFWRLSFPSVAVSLVRPVEILFSARAPLERSLVLGHQYGRVFQIGMVTISRNRALDEASGYTDPQVSIFLHNSCESSEGIVDQCLRWRTFASRLATSSSFT